VLEEPGEDINGVVTEDGEPVEGVTVTEPESGDSATTDANGSYVLRVVPGKPSELILTRNGKRLSTGRVQVQRGRPAVADFELKPRAAPQGKARILPATVFVTRGVGRPESTGRLSGVVRDAQGRPVPRALVTLRGVAAARTDSLGRYSFIGVPAGTHQLIVYRRGLKAHSSQVRIAVQRTSESGIVLAAGDPTVAPQRKPLASPPPQRQNRDGPTTRTAPVDPLEKPRPGATERTAATAPRRPAAGSLRGQVVDAQTGKPVPGASISVQGARTVDTTQAGSFNVAGLPPGTYQIVVARNGYADSKVGVTIRAGETATLNIRLTPRPVMRRR
jgi:hypothetical protein